MKLQKATMVLLAAFAGLTACGGSPLPSSSSNLYDLPMTSPAAVDNDSYYVQPNTYQNYKGCNSISDGPSCGGG